MPRRTALPPNSTSGSEIMTSSDHYTYIYSASAHDRRVVRCAALGVTAEFVTDAGVFSRDGLDTGTAALLEALPEPAGRVLDLGCGWGAVGVLLGKRWPGAQIVMTDVNCRAASLAREKPAPQRRFPPKSSPATALKTSRFLRPHRPPIPPSARKGPPSTASSPMPALASTRRRPLRRHPQAAGRALRPQVPTHPLLQRRSRPPPVGFSRNPRSGGSAP